MFNWSIDWSFITDIFNWVIQKLISFFMGLGTGFLKIVYTILDGVGALLPDPSPLLAYISQFFNLVSPYMAYVIDMSFIASPVLTYLVFSLIFRVMCKEYTYIVKTSMSWYARLKG